MNLPMTAQLSLLATLVIACGPSLDLNLVDSAYRRPSNVAVFFTVDTEAGEPVSGLEAEDFRIYEDDSLVSVDESKQTIVNQEVAAEHYTLLLVDMSGSVTESDQVPQIQAAAREFTTRLEQHQKVAVYAFDGSEKLHPIARFRSGGAPTGQIGSFRAKDPSTNLNGAIVSGIEVLNEALAKGDTPLRFGTLVVFTDGTDRAARVSAREMRGAINDAGFDVFAIGVGNEIDEDTLADIGRNGYVKVADSGALAQAFQVISESIIGYTQRFYLLSYCSPARAGSHEVTIEAIHGERTGEVSYRFDATGFGPRCDPNKPPPFKVGKRIRRPLRERGTRIELNASAGASASGT